MKTKEVKRKKERGIFFPRDCEGKHYSWRERRMYLRGAMFYFLGGMGVMAWICWIIK